MDIWDIINVATTFLLLLVIYQFATGDIIDDRVWHLLIILLAIVIVGPSLHRICQRFSSK